ncbi:FtsW/RodA/SpoVE family cell cycle protein [Anaerosphaera multitolerans]|nr:putative peptidoglycan glycosyltransferase FtsW [Anaerosphaera multitolerans]
MKNYKQKIKEVDLTLLVVLILLLGFGLIAVTSASYPEGIKSYNNGFYFVKRQIAFMVLGFVAMLIVYIMPRKMLQKLTTFAFVVSLCLVALLWSPLAKVINGQARWIIIPIINIRVQPSDFVKVTSVLYLANYLEANRKNIGKGSIFIMILVILVVSVVPIMTKDFSTAVVIGASLFFMFLVAGMKPHQFVSMAGLGAGLIALMLTQDKYKYRISRILGFAGDTSIDTYQIDQAQYAIAMGRIKGVGLFQSRQKYGNVPFAYNDFIFPIICEEFGLIGGIFLIVLFILLIYRGYTIAYRAKNYFDKFVAVGLTTYLGVQAIFNLGVSTKLLPVTGITLPFISYGGTALLVAMVSVGILLRISKDV